MNATGKNAYKKRKRFFVFLFLLITLFLISFSVTSFILMNSYRLSFTEKSHALIQQELEQLKRELTDKETEIEELKLKLSNYEGESSFVNELTNSTIKTHN